MPVNRSPMNLRSCKTHTYNYTPNTNQNMELPASTISTSITQPSISEQASQYTQPQPPQLLPNFENSRSSSLKLPFFYDKYPQQWFLLAESQFRINNINHENDKFDKLLLALSQDLFVTVSDVIQNINDNWQNPNSTPYTTLKETLLERNSLSESQRLENLLKDFDIGDRKPSEFYRALKQTAGQSDSITDKLLTQLWIRKLPMQIQISLKTLPNPDIKTLMSVADSIFEIFLMNNQHQLQAITSSNTHELGSDRISLLERQIQLLTESVQKLTFNSQNSRFRYRSKSRSNSKSRNTRLNPTELCWYHQKFGDNAKKCILPCNFPKND